MCDRNQVSVLGPITVSETKLFGSETDFFFFSNFLLLGIVQVFTSLKLNKDFQNKTRKSLIFVSKFGIYGGKITHKIFPFKCGFGIGYGVSRKYRRMWVLVLISDLN